MGRGFTTTRVWVDPSARARIGLGCHTHSRALLFKCNNSFCASAHRVRLGAPGHHAKVWGGQPPQWRLKSARGCIGSSAPTYQNRT